MDGYQSCLHRQDQEVVVEARLIGSPHSTYVLRVDSDLHLLDCHGFLSFLVVPRVGCRGLMALGLYRALLSFYLQHHGAAVELYLVHSLRHYLALKQQVLWLWKPSEKAGTTRGRCLDID